MTVYLHDSQGVWIAFRSDERNRYLFNPDGDWIGWFPWDDDVAVTPGGAYLGTVRGDLHEFGDVRLLRTAASRLMELDARRRAGLVDPVAYESAWIDVYETLPGGVRHEIIERDGDTGYLDNTRAFEVPPNNYFMMGDNRDNSTDSRVPADQGGVGYVPFENFVGRAEVIFFSVRDGDAAWEFWKWPWSVRWSRLFRPVR